MHLNFIEVSSNFGWIGVLFKLFGGAFGVPKKVSQSGFGPVIVCHFALSSIWAPPKHPRITKNHQISGECHPSFGDFHLNLIEIA